MNNSLILRLENAQELLQRVRGAKGVKSAFDSSPLIQKSRSFQSTFTPAIRPLCTKRIPHTSFTQSCIASE